MTDEDRSALVRASSAVDEAATSPPEDREKLVREARDELDDWLDDEPPSPQDRLEEVAREQWGEQWTIEARYFADDTARLHAYSNRGRTDDGLRIRERLMPGEDGELHLECVRVDGAEEIVEREVLESPVDADAK